METLVLERHDKVCVLTLNRPEVRNAVDFAMWDEMTLALREIDEDHSISALVVTGSEGAFCGGADLNALLGEASPGAGVRRIMAEDPIGSINFARCRVPVVTAVNGAAAGGGVGMALQGDVILAARSALFLLTFGSRLGLVPDMGATWYLPRFVGLARALPMAMLGEPVTAEQAETWGLIWRCVDDEQLADVALETATRLANAPTRALVKTRELMQQAVHNDLFNQLVLERDCQVHLAHQPECLEGISAFLQRREADFNK